MSITAKIVCIGKTVETVDDGDVIEALVTFSADYADGRNKEWSRYPPNISVQMMLNGQAAGLFEQGKKYTLVFEPTVDEQEASELQ